VATLTNATLERAGFQVAVSHASLRTRGRTARPVSTPRGRTRPRSRSDGPPCTATCTLGKMPRTWRPGWRRRPGSTSGTSAGRPWWTASEITSGSAT
jgi:hypothetical protein